MTKSKLPKPQYFLEEKTERKKIAIGSDTSPNVLGDPYECTHKKAGGWLQFVVPEEQLLVSLRLPYKGKPYHALQEWLIRLHASRADGERPFDVHGIISSWNAGLDPKLTVDSNNRVQVSGSRGVTWEHMAEAIEVWSQSGQRGIYPPDLAAILDPDHRVPILSPPMPGHTPPENRWVAVSIDLMGPLDDQLKEIRERLKRLRAYAFMVAGRRPPRSRAREVGRDVLVFTLHYSAGLTVPKIAKRVFPKEEPASAEPKVKKRLTLVRKAVQGVATNSGS